MTGRLVGAVALAFATALLIAGSAVGVAPVVTITSPADGAFVNDATPTIEGSASDTSDVTVEIWSGIDTSGIPLASQTTTPSAGAWSLDLAALAEGGYTLIASQTDATPETGESAERTFTVDTEGPVVTISTPVAGAFVNDTTPTVTGSASEASDVTVRIWAGSDTLAPPLATQTATPDLAGDWSLDLTTNLADDSYTLIASQTDAAAVSGESAPRDFTIDTTPPTVALTGGPGAGSVQASGAATFSFVPSEPVSAFECGLDAAVFSSCTSATTYTGLADGLHTFSVRARDVAGNLGVATSRSWTVAVPPAHVDVLTARPLDHRVVLTWNNPTDPDFNRVVVRRGTAIVYQGKAESLDDRGLYNGTVYTYTFTAVDSAGNVSAARSVNVKPRGKLWRPRDGSVIRVAPVLEWAKVPRATYYNVQLWRNGRKILSRWPTRPAYELRMRWRYGGQIRNLRDGTYLWYVWPGFGDRERGRYGRMLGSATFFKR
jgi:hypothetical protein